MRLEQFRSKSVDMPTGQDAESKIEGRERSRFKTFSILQIYGVVPRVVIGRSAKSCHGGSIPPYTSNFKSEPIEFHYLLLRQLV